MNSLEFKSVRLKNYRQYGGEQTIDLSTDTGRINVIEGQNGAGKSNLLNAITLCFYGQEEHQSNSDEDLDSLPYVTRSLLEDVEDGGQVTGFVEVTLGTDSPEYVFRRDFKTYKSEKGFSNTHGDLKLQRRVGTEWKEPENPSTHLNQVLPSTVADYFLFDGEDLDAFFEEGYADRVQDAILDVSHIELLNRALDHLEKVRDDIEGKASNLEGEAGRIRDDLEEVEDEIEELEERHSSTKTEISNTDEEIDRIDRKLQDISDEYVRDLYDEREELQEEVKQNENRIEELTQKSAELMVKSGPAIYTHEALDFTLETFEGLSEKGQIPPKIQDWFIDELIERGQCICGTDLSEDDKHAEHLRELQSTMSDVNEENLEGKSRIPALLEKIADQVERLHENRSRIAELEGQIQEDKQEIQDITEKLKQYDIPEDDNIDIENLEEQREELETQKEELQMQLGRLEKQIEDKEDKEDNFKKELRRELQKESRYEDIISQLDFADTAYEQVKGIKSKILGNIRGNTEENLEKYFNEIIWKDEEYEILLHDDYSIEVKDQHGDNKIGSLSAGEKQVLALSFMAALTRISGFDAPILIDTPLGRISSEPKRRIASNLPHYVEDTQITFLMTDEEYTSEVRAMMEGELANEYELEFNNTVTKVIER